MKLSRSLFFGGMGLPGYGFVLFPLIGVGVWGMGEEGWVWVLFSAGEEALLLGAIVSSDMVLVGGGGYFLSSTVQYICEVPLSFTRLSGPAPVRLAALLGTLLSQGDSL